MNILSRAGATVGLLAGLFTVGIASAAEIIVAEDFKQKTVIEDQLVKVADNAIFLLDTSKSMEEEFGNTGMSAHQVVLEEFKKRNAYFPDLGHNFGIYKYTPWTPVYPMQPYDREKVAKALESVSPEAGGPTWLKTGLRKSGEILKTLSGSTALFVFTDGTHTSLSDQDEAHQAEIYPIDVAADLVSKHDVCIYVVSSAKEEVNERIVKALGTLNSCSRVIPFADFVNRPEYNSGALFAVKSTEKIVTVTDNKIVGLKVDDLTFQFAGHRLKEEDITRLQKVADFVKAHPDTWVSIKGYTDAVGSSEVNNRLSQQRAETVEGYLIEAGVPEDRIVTYWYGAKNPVASNDTPEGRAKNRRVELAVGKTG